MNTLKPYQMKLFKLPFNKLGLQPTNSNVLKHMDKIYNVILNNYALSTRRDMLIIFNIVLKSLNQTKAGEIVYKKALELSKEHTDIEYKQCLDPKEKENYVSYDDLILKVDELINTYNNDKSKENMINLLILALYVLHEPIRNNYYNMKIIRNDALDNRIDNYLLITNNMYYFIINTDKVSKHTGRIELPVMNKTLRIILDIYINTYAYNQTYLFERKPYEPYTKRMFAYKISNYFKDVGKILTIHNLRSSYITNFYKNNLDIVSRNELAVKCRHSREMAEKTYCKYFI